MRRRPERRLDVKHLWLMVTILSGASLLGCDDEVMSTPDAMVMMEDCVALLPSCLENQQICVLTDEGPACQPCASGQYVTHEGVCADIEGTAHRHEFPEFNTPSGDEVLGLCRSWTLGNPEEIWVNAVELTNTELSHHSNWTFVPNDQFDGPDGVWPCSDRGYSQLEAAVFGGVLYAQSTQAEHEVQKFPEGVAVRIAPYSRIISDIHILNVTPEPVVGSVELVIYEIPADEVEVRLTPFHVDVHSLDIPPRMRSRFRGECDVRADFAAAGVDSVDMDIYYILPHTHALGVRFFLEAFGGEAGDQQLFDIYGFNGEARGQFYSPPMQLRGIEGFRFGCEFENPHDGRIGWGFGDQEMCEALGFAASPVAFESRIADSRMDGTDGDIETYGGTCSTLAFAWSHDRPGGEPR